MPLRAVEPVPLQAGTLPPAGPRGFFALLEATRPRQWSKNVFVLAGVVFAGRLFDSASVLRALACFALFCAAASAVYLANDALDCEADAHHPQKRGRPIASGRLSSALALPVAALLGAGALVGAGRLSQGTFLLIGGYLASSLLYSMWLKRVFILDVLVVAAGFVLRAAAGAAAVRAEISPWLLCCTFLLALFLVLGKRRHELVLLGEEAAAHRSALDGYSLRLLDQWLTALTGATIVSYAIYTQSQRTVEHFGTTALVYTVPFVIYALFRYQSLVASGQGGDPGLVLARDKGMLVAIFGWAATAALVIYR